MRHDMKRLFFAFEVDAPWPEAFPSGRLIEKHSRHLTLAFLGNTDFAVLQPHLGNLPLPAFKVGLTGVFEKIRFLPTGHPRVAAWEAAFYDHATPLEDYVPALVDWLKEHRFHPDDRLHFLPHVTVCRAPFDIESWRADFKELPVATSRLHLYESTGQLNYKPIWTHNLLMPFEELDHTADIAFLIRANTVAQLYHNAFTALSFKYPLLVKYKEPLPEGSTIEGIVIQLNRSVSHADSEVGCPFKAVSFHGEIVKETDETLKWEMIVDV